MKTGWRRRSPRPTELALVQCRGGIKVRLDAVAQNLQISPELVRNWIGLRNSRHAHLSSRRNGNIEFHLTGAEQLEGAKPVRGEAFLQALEIGPGPGGRGAKPVSFLEQ